MTPTFKWNQGFTNQCHIDLDLLSLSATNLLNFMNADGISRNPSTLNETISNLTVISEDLTSAPTGILTGAANYDAANDWAQLTPNTASQHGELEWLKYFNTRDFTVQWSQYLTNKSGGGDAIYFYWGCNATPTLGEDDSCGGYLVALDHYSTNRFDIHFGTGTTISTNSLSSDPTDGAWHIVKIVVLDNNIKIYYDTVLQVDFTDTTTRTLPGMKFGWGARTGAAYCEHRIKNLSVTLNKYKDAYYYKQYPIITGNRSYEVWLRGHFSGTYTSVTNAKFWAYNLPDQAKYPIYAKVNTTYVQPTKGTSQAGFVLVPIGADAETPPASPLTVDTTGLVNNADGYTQWITLQLEGIASMAPNAIKDIGFTLQYDWT